VRLEQAVFGYREGHRLLSASLDLSAPTQSLLLGATDAALGSGSERLLTGLPLPVEKMYALSATWDAPEIDRPGAVWAHTVFISFADLASLEHPASLVQQLRRPSSDALDAARTPLRPDLQAESPSLSADRQLMTRILSIATDGQPSVFTHQDLIAAESTLLVLWTVQWPALRAEFSFRTRESARWVETPSIVVARRIRGLSGQRSKRPERHEDGRVIDVLEGIADDPPSDPLRREFIWSFGPLEETSLGSLVFLAKLSGAVADENIKEVLTEIAVAHPSNRQGKHLKQSLFGREETTWWRVSELVRVKEILATRKSMFDPRSLKLTERVRKLISRGHVEELFTAWNQDGPKGIRDAFVEGTCVAASAQLVRTLIGLDEEFTLEVLHRRPDLLRDPETWEALPAARAADLISQLELKPDVVAAATRAGHTKTLLKRITITDLLDHLVRGGALGLIKRLTQFISPSDLRGGIDSRAAIELAISGAGLLDRPRLIEALDERRSHVDEAWLRAAVLALEQWHSKGLDEVLQVVFGPLHSAITEDRLPRDLWRSLDKLLPHADDPAHRLRRLLVERLRQGDWSRRHVELALRDAGPFIREFKYEVPHDDQVWSLLHKALQAEGR